MNARTTEFKVGLFTIVGLTAGITLFVFLNPGALESSEVKSYHTILKDASGIVPKTHVKTNGVSVGKVSRVELGVGSTKVFFDIDASVEVPNGSTIDIRTVGLLGDKFIDIRRRDDTSQGFIEDGGFIPRSTDSLAVDELIGVVGSIARDVKRITESMAGALGEESGASRMKNIVENLESVTASASAMLVDNQADLRKTMANLRAATDSLRAIVDTDNADRIERILASFDQSMDEVRGATKNIRLIAEKVEAGEGTLGKLVNDDKTISEIQAAIKDVREVIAPATKLKIGVDYHGEAYAEAAEMKNYFNLHFKTRPDRFYILGVTDGRVATVDTHTETIPVEEQFDPNVTTRQRETIDREARLRINLQIAKRWWFTQLRFGLFESTGGLGADVFAWRDRLRFSVEAFDWKTQDNPLRRVAHLKTYASVLFFNHLYMMGGIDDPTRIDPATGNQAKDPNYFLGAGVAFDDNDLKAIFGTAALVR